MWQWLAYLALFYAAFHLVQNAERVEKLTFVLFLGGIGFGAFGVVQWLLGVQSQAGSVLSTAGIRATGSFGNANHYATFMGMLLLCGLGWIGARRASLSRARGRRRRRVDGQEAKARLVMGGLGIVVIGLGLIFSLSRSGITFTLAGCVALALLTRGKVNSVESETIEIGRSIAARSLLPCVLAASARGGRIRCLDRHRAGPRSLRPAPPAMGSRTSAPASLEG